MRVMGHQASARQPRETDTLVVDILDNRPGDILDTDMYMPHDSQGESPGLASHGAYA